MGDEPTTVKQVICNEDEHKKTGGEQRSSYRERCGGRRHVSSEGGSLCLRASIIIASGSDSEARSKRSCLASDRR